MRTLCIAAVVAALVTTANAQSADVQDLKRGSDSKEPIEPLKLTVAPSQTGPRDIYDALTLFVQLENVGREPLNIRAVYVQVGDDLARTRMLKTTPPKNTHSAAGGAGAAANTGPTGAGGATTAVSAGSANTIVHSAGIPSGSNQQRQADVDAVNISSDGKWFGRKPLSEKFDIAASHQSRVTLIIPSASGRDPDKIWWPLYFWDLLTNPYLLTFSPQQHEVQVVAEYGIDADDLRLAIVPLKLPFTASVGAIILGGFLGCFLLCTFRAGVLLIEEASQFESKKWKEEVFRWVAILFREYGWMLVGCPAVIILVLLLTKIGGADFPITFKVSDFAGGILLGIFARTLVRPLSDRLFPKAKDKASVGASHKKTRPGVARLTSAPKPHPVKTPSVAA